MKTALLLASAMLALLSGCATPGPASKYEWGSYEESVYTYYKNPAKLAEFSAAMEKMILTAEKNNRSVAPGMYAEYGYLLVQQGRNEEALAYFDKEEKKWPESTRFMEKMKSASLSSKKAAPEAGATK